MGGESSCSTKFRLCRAFREQVGLPPYAYVTHRRVSLAQQLLGRGLPQYGLPKGPRVSIFWLREANLVASILRLSTLTQPSSEPTAGATAA